MTRALNALKIVIAVALMAWAAQALADFPAKPLRLMVPFPPGGENRPGASSAQLAAEMQSDVARLGGIVKEAGIRAD